MSTSEKKTIGPKIMEETDDKAKYVRVMATDAGFVAMDDIEDSSEDEEQYNSHNEGELFLYQMAEAIAGVKEVLPKINFRRKHPKLGKKIANIEQRVRRIEKTLLSFKNLLAPHLLNGMKKDAVDYIDRHKDDLINSL